MHCLDCHAAPRQAMCALPGHSATAEQPTPNPAKPGDAIHPAPGLDGLAPPSIASPSPEADAKRRLLSRALPRDSVPYDSVTALPGRA